MTDDIIKNTFSYLCAEACTKNTNYSQYLRTYNNNVTMSFSNAPSSMSIDTGGIQDYKYNFNYNSTTLKITGNVTGNVTYFIYGEVGSKADMGYYVNKNKTSFTFRGGSFFVYITKGDVGYTIDFYDYKDNGGWTSVLYETEETVLPVFNLVISNTYLSNIRCYYISSKFDYTYNKVCEYASRIKGSISLYKDKTMCAPYYFEDYSGGNMTFAKTGVYIPGELIEGTNQAPSTVQSSTFTKTGNIKALNFIEY